MRPRAAVAALCGLALLAGGLGACQAEGTPDAPVGATATADPPAAAEIVRMTTTTAHQVGDLILRVESVGSEDGQVYADLRLGSEWARVVVGQAYDFAVATVFLESATVRETAPGADGGGSEAVLAVIVR
ncbi:MAG: hypothetical protein LBJ44_08810 [Propionibacteriaceae bacterium]|jgi:hypothetical protein|nr:hypothetical protein [Propionibacteriaceae bacterium]